MLSANCFNLDHSKILSSGNGWSLYHAIMTFNDPVHKVLWEQCAKREKMLVTGIFFSFHNVFNLSTSPLALRIIIQFWKVDKCGARQLVILNAKKNNWKLVWAMNYGLIFFLNYWPTSACASKMSFENIVGRGENADNQHFLLFLQCFQPFPKLISIFQSYLFCHLQNLMASMWTSLKICCVVKS